MDNNSKHSPAGRSDEEVAWDEEFNDTTSDDSSPVAVLTDLARLAVQIPAAVIQMPMDLLPKDTRQHARAALREGFLALRSLLGSVADTIENALAEPGEKREATVSGPPGTWGNTRHSNTGTAGSGRVNRISISDSSEAGQGSDLTNEEQGRGLRADIDY